MKETIRQLQPYQPGKSLDVLQRELGVTDAIKLASNENPLGPSEHALRAAQQALLQPHIYPDHTYLEIKQAIAQHLGVSSEQIVVGNGSENIIELIAKTFLQPSHQAVMSQYTFLTISIIIKSYDVTIIEAATSTWRDDVDALLNAITENTRLLFLVNPNNPLGTYITKSNFEKLLMNVPPHVLIVVDEAYFEYVTQADFPNALTFLSRFPNLIVIRTFSKLFGLAGLRLGYAVASADIADKLNRARLPFNVNAIAMKAGCAAISDHSHVQKSIALIEAGRKQLENALNRLKLDFIPSVANFITVNVGNGDLVYQQLLHHGVIVKHLQPYGMLQYIRVTIGTFEQNERFINALEIVVGEINDRIK